MAKIDVTINSAGGGSGQIKNKVFERKVIDDKWLGIKQSKNYKIKHSGINQFSDDFPSIPFWICQSQGQAISYSLYENVEGHNDTIPVITFSNYRESLYCLYIIEDDKWVYNSSPYNIELIEDDLNKLVLNNISSINNYQEGAANLLAFMIINEDGSEFVPTYTKFQNIMVEDKMRDLKNWYYEDGDYGVLNIPNWEEFDNINDNEEIIVFENADNSVDSDLIVFARNDGDNYYYVTIQDLRISENRKEYYIQNVNGYGYEANCWYLRDYDDSEKEPIKLGKAPDIEFDEEYINYEYIDLFEAIVNYREIYLKNKFAEIEKKIATNTDGSILKDKIYDNTLKKELTAGKKYNFKNDCDDFFEKHGEDYTDIYVSDFSMEVPQLNALENSIEYVPETEEIGTITYTEINGTPGIIVTTNITSYQYVQGEKGWYTNTTPSRRNSLENNSKTLPPELLYNAEYVRDIEKLSDILDLAKTQTLGEKFDEPIKKWNYDKKKGQEGYKPIFDIVPILMSNLEAFANAGLFESQTGTLLYQSEKVRLLFTNNNGNDGSELIFAWLIFFENENEILYCNSVITTAGSSPNVEWQVYKLPVGVGITDNAPVATSQDELPFIDDYDASHIVEGYEDIVSVLVKYMSSDKKITLEDKVKDLKNWYYETTHTSEVVKDGEELTLKEVIDFSNISSSGDIYIDETNGVYISYISQPAQNPGEPSNRYIIYINGEYEYRYRNGWVNLSDYSSVQPIPFIYDASCVNDSYALEQVANLTIVEKKKVYLKEKFETCLTLERLSQVEIDQQEIVSNTYNEYSTEYPYMIEIEDEAFKDALKVEVLFTLTQLDSGNFCPLQEIDAENGIMTLFLKQNNANILLNRIDVFKFVKTSEEEDDDDDNNENQSPSIVVEK